jgi:hypothetical protein
MSELMMSMLLTLLFTCLAILGVLWTEHAIQTPLHGSCFLPELLSDNIQVVCHTFSDICRKFEANSMFSFRIQCEFVSGEIHDSKERDIKYNNLRPTPCNFVRSLPI